jgi:hypothetical protein
MTIQKRECGDCNMCCKLYSIHEPKDFKKDYEWCKHCEVGVGCKIYESRPKQCKDFQCGWSLGLVPEEWKPNKVGFVVTVEKAESYIYKVFTVHSETHKVKNLHKHLSKFNFTDTDGYEWHYVIRYNSNEKDMAVFDRRKYGNQVKFCKRGEL